MESAARESALLLTREREAARGSSPLEQEVVDLFDQLRAPLLRYTVNFGLPVQDAEEVIQEVFLGLFQHLRQGKPRDNLRGWVFRVAHNLALKRRASLTFSEAGDTTLFPDPAPNPEDQLAGSQARERVLAAFKVLPEQDRRCLLLRAEGLRYREISHALGMSLGAVSISLSRSLGRLARAADR